MKYMFDYLVFIGRFQPFHLAHLQTVKIALEKSHNVILALGSAQHDRNIKNPFLAIEREEMILANLTEDEQKRIVFVHVHDVYNDEKWRKLVKELVEEKTGFSSKIGLIGHFKDDSSYYLKFFPEWEMVELESLQNSMSATPMREAYYRGIIDHETLPIGTIKFLQKFQTNPIYQQLQLKFQNQDKTNL